MNAEPKLTQRIVAKNVAEGHVAGWWLGGSGFVFKTHPGTVIYVDPYLSNSLKDILGLERGFDSPIAPGMCRQTLSSPPTGMRIISIPVRRRSLPEIIRRRSSACPRVLSRAHCPMA